MENNEAIKIAKDKQSTAEQLNELLGISDEIDQLLANHPSASEELLDKLCERHFFDKKIARAAVSHPNIGIKGLLNVGEEYPMAVYSNPSLPAMLKKHKDLLGGFGGDEFEKSLKKDLPSFVVDWLASQGDAQYQTIYLSAPKRSAEEIAKFRESKHPGVVVSLLKKDDATYLAWAREIGFEETVLKTLPALEIRARIDQLVNHVLRNSGEVASGISGHRKIHPDFPDELREVLKEIELAYFKGGRASFNTDLSFYEAFLTLIRDALKGDAGFTKLVGKVIDYDLAQIKKFANPGKKPPSDITKASYYVKSGLDISFGRLMVALAAVCERQPEAYANGLCQTMAQLVASHPIPCAASGRPAGLKTAAAKTQKVIDMPMQLVWARELGFTLPPPEGDEPVDEKWELENWSQVQSDKISALWTELVPREGAAATLQGELVRAIVRLESEFQKNEMMNWGDGSNFYENFAKLIHSTLRREKSFSLLVLEVLDADIAAIEQSGAVGKALASDKAARQPSDPGGRLIERDVERSHERLRILIAAWCELNPNPVPYQSSLRR